MQKAQAVFQLGAQGFQVLFLIFHSWFPIHDKPREDPDSLAYFPGNLGIDIQMLSRLNFVSKMSFFFSSLFNTAD
jgi:hypothetical protein